MSVSEVSGYQSTAQFKEFYGSDPVLTPDAADVEQRLAWLVRGLQKFSQTELAKDSGINVASILSTMAGEIGSWAERLSNQLLNTAAAEQLLRIFKVPESLMAVPVFAQLLRRHEQTQEAMRAEAGKTEGYFSEEKQAIALVMLVIIDQLNQLDLKIKALVKARQESSGTAAEGGWTKTMIDAFQTKFDVALTKLGQQQRQLWQGLHELEQLSRMLGHQAGEVTVYAGSLSPIFTAEQASAAQLKV